MRSTQIKKREQILSPSSIVNSPGDSDLKMKPEKAITSFIISPIELHNTSSNQSSEKKKMIELELSRPESFRFCCSSIERKAYFALAKKGFTDLERWECWLITSGALQSMYAAPEGYYESLVVECEKLKSIKCPLPSFHQIKLDMHRTFADETFFT